MYQENEDDWKILKEYKQELRNKHAKERDYAEKVGNRCLREKPKVEKEIAELEAEISAGHQSGTSVRAWVRRNTITKSELRKQKKTLAALEHDIKKAEELKAKHGAEVEKLNQEIDEIDAKLRELRTKRHEKEAVANKEKKEAVQKCPKKCRISDIKISCSHGGRSMPIPAFEKETPEFHVVSGTAEGTQDVLSVNFGGTCKHGKSQSADDSDKHNEKSRLTGADQYCPRVIIKGTDRETNIERPNGTKFVAGSDDYFSKSNATPIGFLFNRLVFGSDAYDTHQYDLSFTSCQGDLPYKATVIAHPKCEWKVEFSCGYKCDYEKNQLKGFLWGNKTVDTYDELKSQGKWSSAIKAEYSYDYTTNEINQELNLEQLLKEIAGEWSMLKSMTEKLASLNGFLESAIRYSKDAEKDYDKRKSELESLSKATKGQFKVEEYKTGSVTVDWPNVKISGGYKRAENASVPYNIYGEGSLSLEFAPLIGLTGKLDVLQLLMHTAGALGPFLRKVSNMSIGYMDDDGKLDKSRAYIETNLELSIGLTSNISGALAFSSNPEKGWHMNTNDTGITGLIGIIFEGKAKVEGKVWEVKIGAGAEFKTTDESGTKPPGIEATCRPQIVEEKFACVGTLLFNGLTITWALYANAGVDGATDHEDKEESTPSQGTFGGGATASTSADKDKKDVIGKTSLKREVKSSGKYPVLGKRILFGGTEPKKIGT